MCARLRLHLDQYYMPWSRHHASMNTEGNPRLSSFLCRALTGETRRCKCRDSNSRSHAVAERYPESKIVAASPESVPSQELLPSSAGAGSGRVFAISSPASPALQFSWRQIGDLCRSRSSAKHFRLIASTDSNPSRPFFAFSPNLSTLASSIFVLIFCHPPASAVILASWSKIVCLDSRSLVGRYMTVSRTLKMFAHVKFVLTIVTFFATGST